MISCRKNLDTGYYYNCHREQNLDSTGIANRLIGSWTWKEQYGINDKKSHKAGKTVIVIFNMNGSFSFSQNGTVTNQGSWSLTGSGDQYALQLVGGTGAYNYLGGSIYFCGSEVLFAGRASDTSDNLFAKN